MNGDVSENLNGHLQVNWSWWSCAWFCSKFCALIIIDHRIAYLIVSISIQSNKHNQFKLNSPSVGHLFNLHTNIRFCGHAGGFKLPANEDKAGMIMQIEITELNESSKIETSFLPPSESQFLISWQLLFKKNINDSTNLLWSNLRYQSFALPKHYGFWLIFNIMIFVRLQISHKP